MLLNPLKPTLLGERLKYQTPLSSNEVLAILESRKETMDPKEYEKLISFFNDIKNKIDEAYKNELKSSLSKLYKNLIE
jgi:hypothetical protein